ncbi:bile acid:sodium symporter family protein [Streptomyces sp. NBC_00083]|uniref:bile acid:sodium symporter family protein n=1 Tax=Streptomyces sp. NBC_00083 TaxID=2975647 RepID=UPI002253C00C|nr:bile acid:sodium symporter [Streptomyces sp. NBC_00083]MCX5388150.1 bile acid:sodium symporter [Streptomyces sp. NBC_00083]
MITRGLAAAQRWLLGLMLGCYALAGVVPGPGEILRGSRLPFPFPWGELTLPMALLAVMLGNAGLGVRVGDVGQVVRRPWRLLLGIAANALLPVVLLPALAFFLRSWPDPSEVECLLVGVMLVLAMPIAGGAASWGQNAGGNVPLVVAMVLGSTALSPLTVPLGLHLAARLVGPEGVGGLDDTTRLDGLAGTGAGPFALASVVLPCLVGILVRALLGEGRISRVLPWAKAVNLVNILLLCYINAAGALGRAIAHPDPDLLALAVMVSAAACALSFLFGRWMSRWTRCDAPDHVSLTLATGMNNTSAAAVLAAAWFSHRPEVLLPILSYSLLQKTMAGAMGRPPRGSGSTPPAGSPRHPAAPVTNTA